MFSLRAIFLALSLLLTSLVLNAAEETKLTVMVTSAETGKPVNRASVIVKFKHGRNVNLKKITTSWETKTSQEGKISIPSIPHGQITIQVIAENYQTFGKFYDLTDPEQTIAIALNPPQTQYSEDSKSDKIVRPRR